MHCANLSARPTAVQNLDLKTLSTTSNHQQRQTNRQTHNHGCFQKNTKIRCYQTCHRPARCTTRAQRQSRCRRKERGSNGNRSRRSPGLFVFILPVQHCARSSIFRPCRYELPLAYSPAQASSSRNYDGYTIYPLYSSNYFVWSVFSFAFSTRSFFLHTSANTWSFSHGRAGKIRP